MKRQMSFEVSDEPEHEKLPWSGLKAKDHLSRVVTRAVRTMRERKSTERWAEKQLSRILDYISSDTALVLLFREVRRRRKLIPLAKALRLRTGSLEVRGKAFANGAPKRRVEVIAERR